MKKCILFLFGILLVVANSCGIPSTEIQTTNIPESTTPEMTVPEISQPEIVTKEGLYENDVFSFSIPEGWGLTQSQGYHYDLNTEKNITIHNDSDAKKSVAFFTISSAPMAEGETLQSLFDGAYQKGPDIENAVITPFERDTLSGIDITYNRPWGEPRWIFHDIWLEKDGVVYVLTFQSYPNTYETHALTFDVIMESFSFKQTNSEVIEMPKVKESEFLSVG